jgi:hypothetical protein
MTTMEKNCLVYNQMILLVALVSICAFLSFKCHQMHCWIPVMCYRAQTHSAAAHVSRSRNLLDEKVVNTERGPFWLKCLESATIPAGWGHMNTSKEEMRNVPVAKDYICRPYPLSILLGQSIVDEPFLPSLPCNLIYNWACSRPKFNWKTAPWALSNNQSIKVSVSPLKMSTRLFGFEHLPWNHIFP